jgi:mRNA interferase MazF
MKEGEIYRVEIPVSGGREQAGLRPVIIAQAAGTEKLPTVLVVPLTSKIKAASFPFTFLLEPDHSNNLSAVSVALVFQLRAIDKKRIKSKIGRLTPDQHKILKDKLKEIMGLG